MKKLINILVVTVFVILAAGLTALAQNTVAQIGPGTPELAANNPALITPLHPNQTSLSSLSSLPEADMLI